MININENFLTGTMYAPFCRTVSAPMEEWDRDMKTMAELGYTCLHGFAEWHDIEYEKGRFDFTKIEELNLEVSGVYQTLTGVIKSENACEFLNVTGKEIGDISYTSVCNETNLQSIKLSYTQNGFNVTRSIEYSYLSINLELPISIYIKTE